MVAKVLTYRWLYVGIAFSLLGAGGQRAGAELAFPGPPPGRAKAAIQNAELILSNDAIACKWTVDGGRLRPESVTDELSHDALDLRQSECFQLILASGRTLKASDFQVVREPQIEEITAARESLRLGERSGGRRIRMQLAAPDEDLAVDWSVLLRDGSNYAQQQIVLTAGETPVDLQEIILVEVATPLAQPAGTVDGSPVMANNLFFAFEHPLSKIQIAEAENLVRCSLPRSHALKTRETETYRSVIGVVPDGQHRRGFLYYVERERVQPYRPFLHYNSWYDIGYGAEKILEPAAREVIELFGKELIERRNVVMDSFVPDDGWDNPASLWRFHEGFPNGFTSLQRAAERYDSSLGAWLSPWGGYGQAKQERMKYGREQGFETNKTGFSLAGPRYYQRFRDVCVGMVRDYDLNYFKFDGIGSGGVPSGVPAEFAGDVEALLRLIGELREARADLFINVTTGTWPSPYWLWHGDSNWRSGSDWSTSGWGSKRQQQVTYRDNQTYHNVVQRAPLYPINSLMTQGVMFANHGLPKERDGLVADIRAFFASGTNCQELYITPSLLDAEAWDALAEAARWSRDRADVLVDTHWVGGDPAKGEVYGWASWSARKATLALRNPKDTPGAIALDIGQAFELPPGAARIYVLRSPWKTDDARQITILAAGGKHTFELEPFEVLVFDAKPLSDIPGAARSQTR
ncbi:MAG: hypothetical protein JW741_01975 [Sedimentisphaerales bacterium]|nr:hypothetical protein [Sedimentisphaerales bacterium]